MSGGADWFHEPWPSEAQVQAAADNIREYWITHYVKPSSR